MASFLYLREPLRIDTEEQNSSKWRPFFNLESRGVIPNCQIWIVLPEPEYRSGRVGSACYRRPGIAQSESDNDFDTHLGPNIDFMNDLNENVRGPVLDSDHWALKLTTLRRTT
ncbi:hypothetical protein J6590_022867 [Homalodisca vitripennis]|nr:hypothetical protein J6590_022867 [Homalodisca vitripennis]